MRPEDRDAAHLWDIVQTAREILSFTRGENLGAYSEDRKLQMAVERGLQIIGDAARRLSEGFREAHPEIPWSGIIGQRNVLVHDYADIDLARVWEVVAGHLPELLRQMERLLPEEPIP